MKTALLIPLLLTLYCTGWYSKPAIDFEVLADTIKFHENSVKFPYGCEYRTKNGVIHGYPEKVARQKCITLCKRVYAKWDGTGDFFQFLNRTYAQDRNWYKGVESIYNKKKHKQKQ